MSGLEKRWAPWRVELPRRPVEPSVGGDQRRELRPNATGEEVEAAEGVGKKTDDEERTSVPSQRRRSVQDMNFTSSTWTQESPPALGRRGGYPWTAAIPCNVVLPLSGTALTLQLKHTNRPQSCGPCFSLP
jgi:hypothetical protein